MVIKKRHPLAQFLVQVFKAIFIRKKSCCK